MTDLQSAKQLAAPKFQLPKTGWKLGAVVLAILYVAYDCAYTVNPTERAGVRRLGSIATDKPLQPGLHFKLPLIDKVDRIQVSLSTLHVTPFAVNTIDNQKIALDLNFNYTIPDSSVFHLLYEVGRAGSYDVTESIVPVVKDRAGRVFARHNTTEISSKRQDIQNQVETDVMKAVREQFGLEAHSLQFAEIRYSDIFIQSNEMAVRAKNDAVAAENVERVKSAQARQAEIEAIGRANAAVADAKGRAESVRLEAEANKVKAVLEGQGQAARLKAEIEPFGSVEKYLNYMQAQAALRWDGRQPNVSVHSGAGGGSNPVIVPIPLATPNAR